MKPNVVRIKVEPSRLLSDVMVKAKSGPCTVRPESLLQSLQLLIDAEYKHTNRLSLVMFVYNMPGSLDRDFCDGSNARMISVGTRCN